jgi:hypothetical protein
VLPIEARILFFDMRARSPDRFGDDIGFRRDRPCPVCVRETKISAPFQQKRAAPPARHVPPRRIFRSFLMRRPPPSSAHGGFPPKPTSSSAGRNAPAAMPMPRRRRRNRHYRRLLTDHAPFPRLPARQPGAGDPLRIRKPPLNHK